MYSSSQIKSKNISDGNSQQKILKIKGQKRFRDETPRNFKNCPTLVRKIGCLSQLKVQVVIQHNRKSTSSELCHFIGLLMAEHTFSGLRYFIGLCYQTCRIALVPCMSRFYI